MMYVKHMFVVVLCLFHYTLFREFRGGVSRGCFAIYVRCFANVSPCDEPNLELVALYSCTAVVCTVGV